MVFVGVGEKKKEKEERKEKRRHFIHGGSKRKNAPWMDEKKRSNGLFDRFFLCEKRKKRPNDA